MSKKKTSTFYLTERIQCTGSGTAATATIDLGAYVDVADRQCIAVEAVDFIFQGTTASETVATAMGGAGNVYAQVMDLNRGGTIQFADDRALVGSGTLTYTGSSYVNEADMYPDIYGARDGVRLVVNDQLYLTCESTAVASNKAVNVTVRIKAHVASLSAKDWMAIAIQSTAADN